MESSAGENVGASFSKFFSKWIDSYDREARLYPGLLAVLPIVVLLACMLGPRHPILAMVSSILISCGGPLFLIQTARDLGKALEDKLYIEWGGKPTTWMLRHRDATIDKYTKGTYHVALARALKAAAPTLADETTDPSGADEFYRAATVWLISKTKDQKKFDMVFKELKRYGFQRNLRGLKWLGLFISSIALIISGIHIAVTARKVGEINFESVTNIGVTDAISFLIALAFIICWIFLVTKISVKRAGVAYADRLLRACI